jgi:hypothetical protein
MNRNRAKNENACDYFKNNLYTLDKNGKAHVQTRAIPSWLLSVLAYTTLNT